MTSEPDRTDEERTEREYEPPAAEDMREDYPVATAAGNFTIK